MNVKTQRAYTVVYGLIFLFACAEAKVNEGKGTVTSNGGSGGSVSPILLPLDGGVLLPPATSFGDAKPMRCDDNGQNCVCMNILSLGKTATYGAGTGDSIDAFVQYMNTKSTAKVVMQTTYVPLTEDFLSDYDVVIFQDMEDGQKGSGPFWDSKFTAADLSNLEAWVRAGGAIVSMTGYGGNSEEVAPANKLLKFAGISYNKDDIFIQCPGTNPHCYCSDTSIPFSGWNTTLSEFSTNMKAVGVFYGRSINCADCLGVAESGGKKMAVAKKIDKGRVFVFADEWVTYTSQWGVTPTQWDGRTDCVGFTAKDQYTVPQFWYNILRWSVPDAVCFKIVDAIIF